MQTPCLARFAIRFFLRQIGVLGGQSSQIVNEGKAIFDAPPIDNRYYRNFSHDEKHLTVVPSE